MSQKQAAAIRYKEGTYLEFLSAKGHDLAIKSLENRKAGIRLLNVHEDEEKSIIRATVYIPSGKESFFLKKVEAYANEQTLRGNPKNNDLIRSIDDIKVAMLDSFWVGTSESMPKDTPVWCEIWLRYDYKKGNIIETWRKTEESIFLICSENKIHIDDKFSLFYHECSVLNADDILLTNARIKLILCIKQVMENAFDILGLQLVEHM